MGNVPKIEDGNNFGVSVQEEILAELKNCETEFESLLQQPGSYYASRGKVISKCIKYPEIKDYVNYVEECGEKIFLMHRMTLIDIRNSMATLLDMINKNMDKIKKPRAAPKPCICIKSIAQASLLSIVLKTYTALCIIRKIA